MQIAEKKQNNSKLVYLTKNWIIKLFKNAWEIQEHKENEHK